MISPQRSDVEDSSISVYYQVNTIHCSDFDVMLVQRRTRRTKIETAWKHQWLVASGCNFQSLKVTENSFSKMAI